MPTRDAPVREGQKPMPRRILVTGASGFVGRHLVSLMLSHGHEVFGLQRRPAIGMPQGFQPLLADLSDPTTLRELPRRWDWVVHLAGETIPSGFASPQPALLNLQTTLNLLEHLEEGRVLLVSSCHVYAPSSEVRREGSPIAPQGFYGLSKHLVEQLAPHYQARLDIRVARPFNHLGPGQRQELVVPSLLRRLRAHRGAAPMVLEMQGMDSTRDFISVQDVVSAYQAILELETQSSWCFNVCTGQAVRISDLARKALDLHGMDVDIHFSARPNSSDDNAFLVGDPGLIQSLTTWRPVHSLESTLASMDRALDEA